VVTTLPCVKSCATRWTCTPEPTAVRWVEKGEEEKTSANSTRLERKPMVPTFEMLCAVAEISVCAAIRPERAVLMDMGVGPCFLLAAVQRKASTSSASSAP